MMQLILSFGKHLVSWVKQILKQWTKPATATLVIDTLSDMTRSRPELIAESALG